MAKCYVCGTEDADTWRFCSPKKAFVCISCERACSNYSSKLLPNGCNCRITYMQPAGMLFKHFANTAEVASAKGKYESMTLETLRERYKALHNTHIECEEPETRAKLRVELAAICEVAEEKKRCS